MPMNPEVKAAWVKALRSGEYKQGKGRLTLITTDANGVEQLSHCCLGVLCEILPEIQKTRVRVPERLTTLAVDAPIGGRLERYAYGKDGCTGFLPKEAAEAAGLDHIDPHVGGGDSRLATLSVLNDSFGYDFTQIAGVIEANL